MRITPSSASHHPSPGRETIRARGARFLPRLGLTLLAVLLSCSPRPDSDTLVMIIESSPTNLDPRVGVDAQSEQIDGLLFDNLLSRDQQLSVKAGLAESWNIPDPKTYVFHLRHGVRFSNGRTLTSRDVKWSFDSVLQGKVRSPKTGTFKWVQQIETPDDYTVVFHLKQPWTALLWNVAGGQGMGIVPFGSGEEISQNPVGTGPFRFVSADQDRDVVIERNDYYWGTRAKLDRVRFMVIPDTTTRALELRKGSADLEINALTADIEHSLQADPHLGTLHGPGTRLAYIAFNLRDPILRDVRVRQAVAYAIDRSALVHYLWRDQARLASGLLPPESWAYEPNVTQYHYDPEKARHILDEAGYTAKNGVRFRITMKTSIEESSRAMAAVFQQQLREVGIAMDIRSFETATFLADVTRGEFQMYSLRWVGGNEDPDMFNYAFHSSNIIPYGANRQYYSNPRVDALIEKAQTELDQNLRMQDYAEIQRILAKDLPYVYLWYFDNLMVYSKRVHGLELNPSGNFDFLKAAELQ